MYLQETISPIKNGSQFLFLFFLPKSYLQEMISHIISGNLEMYLGKTIFFIYIIFLKGHKSLRRLKKNPFLLPIKNYDKFRIIFPTTVI